MQGELEQLNKNETSILFFFCVCVVCFHKQSCKYYFPWNIEYVGPMLTGRVTVDSLLNASVQHNATERYANDNIWLLSSQSDEQVRRLQNFFHAQLSWARNFLC